MAMNQLDNRDNVIFYLCLTELLVIKNRTHRYFTHNEFLCVCVCVYI